VFSTTPELVSAKDWAAARIRAMIYSGEFPPDTKLSIDSLARTLGVSRTPVRDAFGQLEREGLVNISSRVGVFVRRLTRSEAVDIYQIKVAVEPLMARWAAERASSAERAALRDLFTELTEAAETDDTALYVRHLESWRRELLRLAGSSPLHDILEVIDGRVRLLRFRNLSQPGSLRISAQQHAAVSAAVTAGDGDAAFAAMHDHMKDAARRMLRVLDADEAESADLSARLIGAGEAEPRPGRE
jgi:GntR family transcriptional regulator, rspAB operon transcriptional repressor